MPSFYDGRMKMLSAGLLVGVVLISLLGGLTLLVRSLRNVSLVLNLESKD